MTYKQGEAAALVLAQALAEWDTTNSVSTANDATNSALTLLSSSASDHYLFLAPGPFESGYDSIDDSRVVHRWQTLLIIAVFVPVDSESVESRLTTYRDNLIAALDARLHLNSSAVSMAKIIAGDEILTYRLEDEEARLFITQEMTLLWEEVKDITQSD